MLHYYEVIGEYFKITCGNMGSVPAKSWGLSPEMRKEKNKAPPPQKRARRFVVTIEGFAYAFLRFNASPATPRRRRSSSPLVGWSVFRFIKY